MKGYRMRVNKFDNNNENVYRSSACVNCVREDFQTMSDRSLDMKREADRVVTYNNWIYSHIQLPDALAKAGLYFTGIDDRVQCPFCHGVLKIWRRSDIPNDEHSKHFPYCQFIRGFDVGNIPIELTSPPIHMASSTSTISTPIVSADLQTEVNRFRTFSRWSETLALNPETLSEAGFYHLPNNEEPDCVKCAYCGGTLYNWQEDDDPWIEHARWFPNCPYIELCMDKDVIRDLSENERFVVPVDKFDVSEAELENIQPTEDMFSEHWNSPAVQANLEMGFSEVNVKHIVERCLQERPENFPSAEELAAMAIDLGDAQAAAAANADADSSNSNIPFKEHEIHQPVKGTFAEYWKSPAVQANLDMGFNEDSVKHIVEICLRERLESFPSAVELAARVMDMEDS